MASPIRYGSDELVFMCSGVREAVPIRKISELPKKDASSHLCLIQRTPRKWLRRRRGFLFA